VGFFVALLFLDIDLIPFLLSTGRPGRRAHEEESFRS
jgi:hypothetical protein